MDWRIYISLLLLIAAIAIAVLLATSGDDQTLMEAEVLEQADEDQVVRPLKDTVPRGSRTPSATTELSASERSRDVDAGSGESVRPTARHHDPSEHPNETSSRTGRQEVRAERSREPIAAVDMGEEEDMRPWNDPVNRRVLGDKRWMAPVSDEEREAIDETFRKAREARYDPKLSRVDTLASKDAAEAIVDDCYDELAQRSPSMKGRIIVRWTSGADERGGWIRDPEILVNYKLEDPEFERCVLRRLDDAAFPAAEAEPRVIEHPFFYDGAF